MGTSVVLVDLTGGIVKVEVLAVTVMRCEVEVRDEESCRGPLG